MKRIFVGTLLILSCTAALWASNVFVECKAAPVNNEVRITWTTRSEDGVRQFVVLRSNDDEHFIELARIAPRGQGNQYEYVDRNVMFKDFSIFFYRVRAVDNSGNTLEEMSLIVHPSVSGIFRTWGAIKAMFR